MTIEELYSLYLAFPQISKDSRENLKGAIYFSLRGDRFDGNIFAAEALKKGAAYAVVDDLSVIDPEDPRYIHVANAQDTLQKLAAFHRSNFKGEVIAITGSNGKTTTKELMARVLSKKFTVSATPGNYNNHIGIPLMLLQTSADTEFVIVEMGASRVGDIASYCKVARPDYGLITNVGDAHLETFGGRAGVRQGKGELYTHISKFGKRVFICADEDHLQGMAKERGILNPILYYDSDLPNESRYAFRAKLIEHKSHILFEVMGEYGNSTLITSSLQGEYNYRNILTSMAVGHYFNIPVEDMARAIKGYHSKSNRSEIRIIGSNEYYLDAYNANPTSMKLSLEAFNTSRPTQKVFVLGDMLELGDYSRAAHQEIVDFVSQFEGVQAVFLVGSEFMKTNAPKSFEKFSSVHDLKADWTSYQWTNKHIFLKGSRSVSLEKLLD